MYVLQTMCLESGFQIAPNWPQIAKMTMTSQSADMTSLSNFANVVLFLFSILVTGPSFMSISLLVLKLRQFSLIRDWQEIRKSEIPLSEFCLISGDWSQLGIPNLAQIPLIKCYWMLQSCKMPGLPILHFLSY